MWLVFASLLPVYCFSIYTSFTNQRDSLRRTTDELSLVARQTALASDRRIEGVRQLLNAITSGPSLRSSGLNPLCLQFLGNIQSKYPYYTNLGFVDEEGNVVCEAFSSAVPRNFSDQLFFKDALAKRSFVVGEFQMDQRNNQPSLNFGMPVYDNQGVMKGIAIAGLDIVDKGFGLAFPLPPSMQVTVTDRKGTVIGTDISHKSEIGSQFKDVVLTAAFQKKPSLETMEGVDPEGVSKLYAVAVVEGGTEPGLYVVSSIPKDEVIKPIQKQLIFTLAFITLLAIMGVLAARWISDTVIFLPTRRLLARIKGLTGDDASVHQGEDKITDEIHALEQSFDRMAAALQAREMQRDISEGNLQKTQERLIDAQRIGKIGNWVYDIDTDEVWWSEQTYKIYGIAPGNTRPALRYQGILDKVHPDDKSFYLLAQQRFRESGKLNVEHRIVRESGESIWVRGRGEAVRNEEGRVVKLFGTVQDITERKLVEEKIKTLNLELDDRVKRRTAELEHVNKLLESFSYSVSHDLRSPLSTISGFSALLEKNLGAHLGEKEKNYLRRIRAATKNMEELIEGLLLLAQSSRMSIKTEAVDLTAIAHLIVSRLKELGPDRRVEVSIQAGMTAQGDARLLGSVIQNLLGNSWKFTAQTPNAKIQFLTQIDQQGQLVYVVKDNGAGFDMALVAKLFDSFQRLHPSSEFEGTGVGLTIVQRIVEKHGGQVWAESEVNQGATFFFTLSKDPS